MKRRTGLVVGALLIAARAAEALPSLPSLPQLFGVQPVYATPIAMRLLIVEAGGATGYTLYRTDRFHPGFVVTSLPGGAADHRVFYLDTNVIPHTEYTYRLDVCNATGCASTPEFTTSVDVVWPISGGRRILHGFNEVLAWAGINGNDGKEAAFHDGVDLARTTPEGTPADDLLAPRGGVVVEIGTPPPPSVDNRYIRIQVDVGDHFERDVFTHLSTAAALPVMQGDIVYPGQKIGVVGTREFDQGRYPPGDTDPFAPTAFDDHVHFNLERQDVNRTTIRHPLTIFTDPADRDPLGHPPALNDENGDGKMVLYRTHATAPATGTLINYDFVTTPLRGDVDVEAEITDVQGTKPEQAPITLGYWIEGPLPESEHHDDVKSADHPYRLYDFRSEYWGVRPETPCDAVSDLDDVANYGCRGVKAVGCTTSTGARSTCNSVLKEGGINFPWPILHHFVVTHAAAETGARNGLDKNQFWRTAAKDDNGPVGAVQANYASKPTTTKAWEARFPDGDYTIHLLASDLVHTDVDVKLPTARTENFAPFVQEIVLSQDADGNPATGLPEAPGCEVEVYAYKNPARKSYPDPAQLAVARASAALMFLRSGRTLCVRIRFSEPMSSAGVDLVRDRGTGAVLSNVGGSFEKTFQDQDTWRGTVTLAADPSGASDASAANDEKDTAIRVTAGDRRDAGGVIRALDTDGDGLGNSAGDVNHLVKLDLSPMKKTVQVTK